MGAPVDLFLSTEGACCNPWGCGTTAWSPCKASQGQLTAPSALKRSFVHSALACQPARNGLTSPALGAQEATCQQRSCSNGDCVAAGESLSAVVGRGSQEYQNTELPNSRIQPDRRWFGNTRVIGQKQLESFRDQMSTKVTPRWSPFSGGQELSLSPATFT